MKYLLLALFIVGCSCPEQVTKTETTRSERDSVSTNLVPKIVYIKGDTVRLYRDTTIYVKDSTYVPTKERLKSKDGKYNVDIDRTNPNDINATVSVKDDSIKTLIAENTYWKWIAENTNTKIVESDNWTFEDKFWAVMAILGVILLITVLRK